MLANYWRLHLLWTDADQSIIWDNDGRIEVDITVWKISSGDRAVITAFSDTFSFVTGQTIANDGERETTVRNNLTDEGYGVEGQLIVTASEASTDGIAYLFLEKSTDDSNWPSDADQFVITELPQIAAAPMVVAGSTDTKIVDFSF